METIDYQKYAEATLLSYPQRYRKHILSLFLEKKIAYEDAQVSIGEHEAVDISGLDLNDQLVKCIVENPASLSVLEEWEFCKDYKYSALFSSDRFDDLLAAVMGATESFNMKYAPLYNRIERPQLFTPNENIALLKFNLKYEAFHPQTAEEMLTRYPVIVAFHKVERIVEIRFDALNREFMENTAGFYARLIEDVCSFIKEQYGFELNPLDLDYLVKHLQNASGDVRLIGQNMRMANGSYAQLEVGKNEEYVLPFIGELKNLLTEHEAEFEKVPEIKEALEQFIFEKEEMSDFPWIEVLWENEIKTRSIRVKFMFNYYQKGYCLLLHYFNNAKIGMERMNHVVRYIDEVRRNPQ